MTALETGTLAPAFSLRASSRDAGEQQVSLTEKDFRGRPLIVAFYPADWSPVCGDQLSLYNAVLPEFERLGAALLGVSVDGLFCHQAYARDRTLRFPRLADFEPKGRMARDYGVYRKVDGTSERALFVLDGNGVIRSSHVSSVDVNPGADGILRALESMRAATPQVDRASGFEVAEPAPMELVEFGDYECPYCRTAHPIVKQIKQRFADRLHFRFRNFPLSQIRPHAKHAAEAAVSCDRRRARKPSGRCMTPSSRISVTAIAAFDDAQLARYAEEVGADGARVLSDLDTGRFEETVDVDFVEGARMGVNGTPTFFINDQRFDGDWRDIEQLAAAIEHAASSETLAVR
jgi:peroxiredoxin